MPSFNEFLTTAYFGNTGQAYLTALAIFIGLFAVFKIFDSFLVAILKKAAKKTKFGWDDAAVDFVSAVNWQFYAFISFYLGTLYLTLPHILDLALKFLMIIFVFYYAAKGLSRIIDHFTNKQIEKRRKADDAVNTSMMKTFAIIFKIAIYSVAILMILANFGIEITPLIASLGVGGIAIALALQSVLGDLFAAFAIYFDKPFKEGDFIIIGNDLGTVQKIGIKTTRIQTLQGQELVVSNTELTNTRINNYKRMEERRIAFSFGVTYDTKLVNLKKINKLVEKAVSTTEHARLDRTHFKAFGDFSLNYEVVYYVDSPDYNLYMDVQQEINFKLKDAFEKEGIDFAFPTQTLFLEGTDKKK